MTEGWGAARQCTGVHVVVAVVLLLAYSCQGSEEDGSHDGAGRLNDPSAFEAFVQGVEAVTPEIQTMINLKYSQKLELIARFGLHENDLVPSLTISPDDDELQGRMRAPTVTDAWQSMDIFGAAIIKEGAPKEFVAAALKIAKEKVVSLLSEATSNENVRQTLEEGEGFKEIVKVGDRRYRLNAVEAAHNLFSDQPPVLSPLISTLLGSQWQIMRTDIIVVLPGAQSRDFYVHSWRLFPEFADFTTPPVVLHAYIPLVDVDEFNAAIHFRPGSHVAVENIAPAVTARCKAGDIILVDWRTHQKDLDNISPETTYYAVVTFARVWLRPFEDFGESIFSRPPFEALRQATS